MKNLFILLFVISAGVTLAQGGQSAATELNVQIFDNWGEDTIDFIMEPIIGNSMYTTIYLDDLGTEHIFPSLICNKLTPNLS